MKKSLKFIMLIFLFFVIIRLVDITYGFYEAIIIGNTNNTSANVDSKYLSVNYTDGTAKMNFKGDYLFPGDTAEKNFSVQNTGDAPVSFSIILDNVINTFTRIQDLRYYLYINDTLVDEGAINSDEMQYLYYKENLAVNGTDSVKFVFKYAETDEVQNEDMNKDLSFRINIVGDVKINVNSGDNSAVVNLTNSDILSNYRIYGNSIQDGTPSSSSPIEIKSVGDLVTDESDENYEKYKIPITVSGKNLFDINADIESNTDVNKITISGNQVITKSSSGSWTYFLFNFVETIQQKVFILHYDLEQGMLGVGIILYDINKELINDSSINIQNFTYNAFYKGYYNWSTDNIVFTLPQEVKYIRVIFIGKENDTTDSNNIYSNIQLEQGETATSYEPYVEPTTTNIYLDEPLRKVDNYVDYIDLKEQRVVRNVVVNDNTGTKSISESYSGLSTPSYKNINLTSLQLHNGTNIISVGTSISPSKIELEYYKK